MQYPQALAAGTLVAGEFRIAQAVGYDGFCLAYDAEDTQFGRPVCLREYFPTGVAQRGPGGAVRPETIRQIGQLAAGRKLFVDEALALARLDHPAIARVRRVVEHNNTAYAVLDAIEGPTLVEWANGLRRRPTQTELDAVAATLIDALEHAHAAGMLHRNITPDHIRMRGERQPLLTDFGTARAQFGVRTRTVHATVHAGYSAPEQYLFTDETVRPATDVFGLCASLYRVVMGRSPQDVVARGIDGSMPRAMSLSQQDYRPEFLQSIDLGMSLDAADRPATMQALRLMLLDPFIEEPEDEPPRIEKPVAPAGGGKHHIPAGRRHRPGGMRWVWVLAGALAAVIGSGLLLLERPEFLGGTRSTRFDRVAKQPGSERNAADDAARKAAEQNEQERRLADKQEAERREAERIASAKRVADEAARQEAARKEQERRLAEKREAERRDAERIASAKRAADEAARQDTERREQERRLAEKQEAERREADRIAAAKRAADEATRREAERREQERRLAEKREAERREAERIAAQKRAAEEAARREAERREQERRLAEKREAERREAERIAAQKRAADEAAKQESVRQAAARTIAEAISRQQAARIAKESDREALLRMASATPVEKAAVEKRLTSLGYVRVASQAVTHWRKPGAGEPFRDCEGCPAMVVIPAGRVLMGSRAGDPGRQEDEDDRKGPGGNQVPVTFARPLAVGQLEVTRGEFATFVRETGHKADEGCYARYSGWQLYKDLSWKDPGFKQDDKHPVVCVSWRDAKAYASWLSRKTGQVYRLLTEAEWEYAARGSAAGLNAGIFHFGNDDRALCQFGNGADISALQANPEWLVTQCSDGFINTAPAGGYKPNGFGIYDTMGNAWEWVEDCYSESLAGVAALARMGTDPIAFTACSDNAARVLKGGSWSDTPKLLRPSARVASSPDIRDEIAGFRVARIIAP